jgi:predicted ester cyclase
MRRFGLLIVPIIGVVVVAASLPTLSISRGAIGREEVDNVSLIRSFYETVADGFRTGSFEASKEFLATDFVDHPAEDSQQRTMGGLIGQLVGLYATYKDVDVEVADVIADNDRVTARVLLTGRLRPEFLGIQLPDKTLRRESIEIYRFSAGKIVERWALGDPVTLLQTLAEAPFTAYPSLPTVVALARLTIQPGADLVHFVLPGPGLLLVEDGELTVLGNGVTVITRDGAIGTPATRDVTTQGSETSLGVGDSVVYSRTRPALRMNGNKPAVVLVLALFQPLSQLRNPQSRSSGNDGPTPDQVLSLAMYPQEGEGSATLPSGISVAPLAAGMMTVGTSGAMSVALGYVVVPPGAGIGPHRVSGVELLGIESGTVAIRVDGNTALVRQRQSSEDTSLTNGETLLEADETVGIDGGSIVSMSNPGDQPLVAWMVTLTDTGNQDAIQPAS